MRNSPADICIVEHGGDHDVESVCRKSAAIRARYQCLLAAERLDEQQGALKEVVASDETVDLSKYRKYE